MTAASILDSQYSSKPATSILLVDDEEDVFQIVRRTLSRVKDTPYILEWVNSYEQALVEMRKNTHAAYLLDYRLGAKSGLELLRVAREQGCHAPIIIITGYEDTAIDLEAMRLGADDYLLKTALEPRYLDKTIRYAIERNRADRLAIAQQVRLSKTLKLSTLGQLATGIAHEISNPIAIIAGMSMQLRRQIEQPEPSKSVLLSLVDKISTTNDRMAHIVKTLRGIARNERDDLPRPASLSAAMREALELCSSKMRYAGIGIEMTLPTPDIICPMNVADIVLVLLNLLTNAIDALNETPPGQRWIKMFVNVTSATADICVQDSGAGIPPALRTEILKPYFSTKADGSGLGLSIAKLIAERHGGNLRLDETAECTSFVLSLPTRPPGSASVQRKKRILIVDDDVTLLESMELALRAAGYETQVAADGVQALSILMKAAIDVLITDVRMPELDGVHLFQRLKAATDHPPRVIFVTGFAPDELRQDLAGTPAVEVLAKPFPVEELIAAIETPTLSHLAPVPP